jgi:two-component system, chemotaxis family, response regulator WspF
MRIGIVNDLMSARVAMSQVLKSSPHHEVAWTANDGGEAIARTREDRPDLILMDLFMPGIDGVEATRQIMTGLPCAILLVTATVSGHLGAELADAGSGRAADRDGARWSQGTAAASQPGLVDDRSGAIHEHRGGDAGCRR